MSSKGIKISAWISIGFNALATFTLMGEGGEGIVYTIGMVAVSVIALMGASQWDKESREAEERETALKNRLKNNSDE